MTRREMLEEALGETTTEIKQAEDINKRKEALRNYGWEILDLLPTKRAAELQEEIIDEIIEQNLDLN